MSPKENLKSSCTKSTKEGTKNTKEGTKNTKKIR